MKKYLASLCISMLPITYAADAFSSNNIPDCGIYLGVGGSYDSIRLDQALNMVAESNVSDTTDPSLLLATGNAGGSVVPFDKTETTFAPTIQAGLFRQITSYPILLGAKLTYQYPHLAITDDHVVPPRLGTLTSTEEAGPVTYFGRAEIEAIETSVRHQLTLLPYIGVPFRNSYIYLGLGPTLLQSKTRLYNVIGYADVNGLHVDVTGKSSNLSSTKWMWGIAAQTGFAYYLSQDWFLDFAYTYSVTKSYETKYKKSFSTENVGFNFTTSGLLQGATKQRITSQGISMTINFSC